MGLEKVATTCTKFSNAHSCRRIRAYSENNGDGQNDVIPSEDRHETPEEVPLLGDLERVKGLLGDG